MCQKMNDCSASLSHVFKPAINKNEFLIDNILHKQQCPINSSSSFVNPVNAVSLSASLESGKYRENGQQNCGSDSKDGKLLLEN